MVRPHLAVKIGAVTTGTKHGGVLPIDSAFFIACNIGKGAVDHNDAALASVTINAFTGAFKHRCGLTQTLFVELEIGNIGHSTDVAQHCVV